MCCRKLLHQLLTPRTFALLFVLSGCDCILIEDIIDTATTMQHAAEELKRQNCRNVYAFVTHGQSTGRAHTLAVSAAGVWLFLCSLFFPLLSSLSSSVPGLFSTPGSAEKIESSPIKELVTTNTVAMGPDAERIQKITILTVAPLLAEVCRRIFQKRTISGLYSSPIAKPAVDTTHASSGQTKA